MSALAKPLMNSTTANNGTPVNVEFVHSINIVTSDPAVSGQSGVYEIIFNFGMNLPSITWGYSTEALRDASYAALISAASVAIV